MVGKRRGRRAAALSIGALAALAVHCSSDKSKDSGNAGGSGAGTESGGASNSSGASSTDAGKTSSSKGGGTSSSGGSSSSSGGKSTSNAGGKTNSALGGGSAMTSGGKGSAGSAQGGHESAGAGNCLAQTFLNKVAATRLLIGASMSDDTAAGNPYTLRYLYLAGGFPDGDTPCNSCTSCTTGGTTCANSGPGCGWWGCWQYDQDPPGNYVRGFIKNAEDHGQIGMVTYYEILQASGASEGSGEVTAVNDVSFMKRFWPNWKFMLNQMGDKPTLLHVEPDFWGYAEQVNSDPSKIPAAVASANGEDCGDKPNTLAGMGACLVSMARKYSPTTLISLHASGWATGNDVLRNSSASLDVAAEGTKLGKFLAAVAPDADFITADISDRDAGYYETQQNRNTWLDETNQKLPNYHQLFAWAKAVTEAAGKPVLWWQVPVGNMSLNNTKNMYKDNAVDYLMSHLDEVAAANGVAVAFGAGDGNTTTPESDGGNLNKLVKAYATSAGQAPCQ